MKKKMAAMTLLLFLVSINHVNALDPVPGWQPTCINSTHLLKTADITFNLTIYPFNQTIQCPYGCDTQRDICHKWPGDAIPSEYFMFFEIVAIGMFFVVLFRADFNREDIKLFDVVLPLFAFFLLLALALQANNVIDMSTGESVRVIMALYLNYGLGFLSITFFFWNLFKFVKAGVK